MKKLVKKNLSIMNLMNQSYMEALSYGEEKQDRGRICKPIAAPRKEGENIIVELDVDDYRRGARELQFSVFGRLSLQRGEMIQTNIVMKEKLKQLEILKFQGNSIKGGCISHSSTFA